MDIWITAAPDFAKFSGPNTLIFSANSGSSSASGAGYKGVAEVAFVDNTTDLQYNRIVYVKDVDLDSVAGASDKVDALITEVEGYYSTDYTTASRTFLVEEGDVEDGQKLAKLTMASA